jgi:hypothetical protein
VGTIAGCEVTTNGVGTASSALAMGKLRPQGKNLCPQKGPLCLNAVLLASNGAFT